MFPEALEGNIFYLIMFYNLILNPPKIFIPACG